MSEAPIMTSDSGAGAEPLLDELTEGVLGADRIANAVGAHDLYGGPTVVVDFGTGNNFDVISADVRFRKAVEYAVGVGLNPIRIVLSAELMPNRYRSLGMALGKAVGVAVGAGDGNALGSDDGAALGIDVGPALGDSDGIALGIAVGAALGSADGGVLGSEVGALLGNDVGAAVGSAVGIELIVGAGDGTLAKCGEKVEDPHLWERRGALLSARGALLRAVATGKCLDAPMAEMPLKLAECDPAARQLLEPFRSRCPTHVDGEGTYRPTIEFSPYF